MAEIRRRVTLKCEDDTLVVAVFDDGAAVFTVDEGHGGQCHVYMPPKQVELLRRFLAEAKS